VVYCAIKRSSVSKQITRLMKTELEKKEFKRSLENEVII
jgi:hypothetical protein